MKKFLSITFLYGVIFIPLAFILQIIIDRGLRDYNDDMYIDWNRIFKGQIKADLVILGSSRASVHFSPKILEEITNLSSYNLGVDGAGPLTCKSKLESFLDYNPAPKIIVQNVDIFFLPKERFIFKKEQYLPYLKKTNISHYLREIDGKIWIENIIPLFKYRGLRSTIFSGIKSYFGLTETPKLIKYKGYCGVEEQWNQDFFNFRRENSYLVYVQENFKFGIDYLENLIKECKNENIEIILVQSPMYYELQNIMLQKDSITSLFSEVAIKNSIQFWNYLDDSLCYSKEYFYNSTHLNAIGAELFSKQLALDINNFIDKNPNKFRISDDPN